MAETEKPRLYYFPIYGRAEAIRIALRYLEIPYEEEVMLWQKWSFQKYSGNYEFQQLPLLEIEGKRLVQSSSILRYICQKHGAYSSSEEEVARIEGIVELRGEIQDIVLPMLYEGNLAGAKAWYDAKMPLIYFPMLEALLADNAAGQGRYFVGEKATMADFVMFEFGFNAFQRPQMSELEVKFAPIAPKFFSFLASFKEERESLRIYMNEPKDKPF